MLFLQIPEPQFPQGLSSTLHKPYAFGPRSGEMNFWRNENTFYGFENQWEKSCEEAREI